MAVVAEERIVPRPALQAVGLVAAIQHVVPGPAVEAVDPPAAEERVVAILAGEHVVVAIAGEHIVTVAPQQGVDAFVAAEESSPAPPSSVSLPCITDDGVVPGAPVQPVVAAAGRPAYRRRPGRAARRPSRTP